MGFIMKMASPSAVAIIETPESFVMEGRPDIPGKLAHSGKLQFFGGHCEEEPEGAIKRELAEELDFHITEDIEPVWAGEVDSQNRAGEAVRRHVSLFRIVIGSTAELNLQVQGEIVEIPKTQEAVFEHQERLTPFAFDALNKTLRGEFTQKEQ